MRGLITMLLSFALGAASPSARSVGALAALAPCHLPGYTGQAPCGEYLVAEDRAAADGRKIALRVVVLTALGSSRLSDPLVFLNDGPGESSIAAASTVAGVFSSVHQERGILLIDQRGTGGSNQLQCPLYGPDPQSYLGDFFPIDAIDRCRQNLEKRADLRLYTTTIAAEDLDGVRRALGYPSLNLFAGSYGTRLALALMRQHPEAVRSALLQGLFPRGVAGHGVRLVIEQPGERLVLTRRQ
jgi:pimeloyl-ACP methyl ester carboxylesterase